jgi:hypothetical protein
MLMPIIMYMNLGRSGRLHYHLSRRGIHGDMTMPIIMLRF